MEIFDEFDSSKKTPKLRTLLKLNTHLLYAENNIFLLLKPLS